MNISRRLLFIRAFFALIAAWLSRFDRALVHASPPIQNAKSIVPQIISVPALEEHKPVWKPLAYVDERPGLTIYVDGRNGDDTNPGTRRLPLRTTQMAEKLTVNGGNVLIIGVTEPWPHDECHITYPNGREEHLYCDEAVRKYEEMIRSSA